MVKKMKQFTLCLNLDQKDDPFIYVSHGSVLFLPGSKSKQNLLSNSAFPLWKHELLFALPTSFSLQQQGCSACFIKKQRSISIRMPLRHQSVCSLLSQRLQDRIKQHISKSIRSFSSSLKRLGYFLPVDESLPPRLIPNLLLLIQTLAFIFYKIHSVLNIMMTVDSLFLFKAVLCIRSSFQSCPRPLLFPSICSFFHLSTFMKTSNPTLPTKKNSCTAWRLCTNDAFSLVFF